MIFAHDTEAALTTSVALINSAGPPDTLTTIGALDDFLIEHSFSGARSHDHHELEAVREVRSTLRELLTSPPERTVALTNTILAEAEALPQLVRHDGSDWHLHVVAHSRPLETRIAVEAAMAMVDVVRSGETSRLGLCAAVDCNGVVVDLSRNRSRKFCSVSCGNRAAVAAYRARKQLGNPPA